MGGEQVLGAAAQDSRIQAVVAEVRQTGSPVTSPGCLRSTAGGNGSEGSERPRSLCWTCSPEQPAPTTLKESVARIAPRSVLLIAAGNVSDEGYATTAIATGSGHVQIWGHPARATHKRYPTAPQLWRETVLGFFDENLS